MASKISLKAGRSEDVEARLQISDNVRGVLIVIGGSTALIVAAYVAMTALTGPDGWATRIANSAASGESVAQTTSYNLID